MFEGGDKREDRESLRMLILTPKFHSGQQTAIQEVVFSVKQFPSPANLNHSVASHWTHRCLGGRGGSGPGLPLVSLSWLSPWASLGFLYFSRPARASPIPSPTHLPYPLPKTLLLILPTSSSFPTLAKGIARFYQWFYEHPPFRLG